MCCPTPSTTLKVVLIELLDHLFHSIHFPELSKFHKFRNTYDKAAEHVYLLLLKKDCYPRFIRSDHYKALLTNAINPGSSRKRIFNFPQIRKKPSTNQPPHVEGAQAHGGGFASTGEF